MAERLGEAFIEVFLDTSRADEDLDDVQSSMRDRLRGVGQSMRRVGAGATAALTAPIVAGATQAVGAASELTESVNAATETFDESSGSVREWAQDSAESMLLPQARALEAASSFGAMLNQTELAGDEAATMSQRLVEVSSDLASFRNEDPSAMLERMRSGIAGEVEPLRRFGVDLSAARVETFAFNEGIAESGEELSQAQKIQARYGLILQQTQDAQGDVARTSGDWANIQRRLGAQLTDAAARIGQQLLPVLEPLAERVVGLVERFGNLSPRTQRIITIVGALAAAIGPLLIAMGALAAAIAAISAPVAIAVGAVAGLIGIVVAASQNSEAFRSVIDSVWSQIRGVVSSAVDAVQAAIERFTAIASTIWEKWGDGILKFAEETWNNISEVVGGVLQVIEGIFDVFAGAFSGDWRRMWRGVRQIASGVWRAIQGLVRQALNVVRSVVSAGMSAVRGLWDRGWSAVRRAVSSAASAVRRAVGRLISGVRSRVNDVVGFFRRLPGRILSALGDLGSQLFDAGADAMSDMASGITSRVGSVTSAASDAVSRVGGWLPGSPADVGPFSGSGAPERRGAALMEDFAAGVAAAGTRPQIAVDSALSGAAAGMTGGGVNVESGAVQVDASGSGRPRDVEDAVDRAFRRFLVELRGR